MVGGWYTLAVSKLEHLEAICQRLDERLEVVEEILEEIRIDVQWGVRNGRIRIVSMAADPCAADMRLNEAAQPTYCPDCDTEVPSLTEAIRQGWADLREREGGFLGIGSVRVSDREEVVLSNYRKTLGLAA